MRDVIRVFNKLVAPLKRRIYMTVRRGTVTLINDALKMQGLQLTVLDGEPLDGIERFENYGFSSSPHPGSEAIVLALSGNTSHSITIAVADRRYRFKGKKPGEAVMYDDLGQYVHLTRTGMISYSPLNALYKTDGVMRFEADVVEVHAHTSYQYDVRGKGFKETCAGGTNYHTDTYTETHTSSSTEQGLSQPAASSEHPEVS